MAEAGASTGTANRHSPPRARQVDRHVIVGRGRSSEKVGDRFVEMPKLAITPET